MKKCIMLGNGINRCMITNISWGDLLNNVAKENGIKLNPNISFPMQFENLANQILDQKSNPSDIVYMEIKNNIITQLEAAALSPNSTHKVLTEKADSILTTNYGATQPAIIWKIKDPTYELETWAVKFFTEDVHIVGFGLKKAEIDIWWLLTYRASLIYANRFNARKLITNKIVFHDVSIARNSDM